MIKKHKMFLLCCGIIFCIQAFAQNIPRKRRFDSFFGVHFDFHAQPNDNQIGKTLTPEMVDTFLSEVKPDFIQVDTKGHPGISSYPTKVGVAAAGIVKDPLKIFREVTARKRVALYSHFSGVLDEAAVKNPPEWARVNVNGQRDGGATSIFGNYCDNYFIPQIEELSKKYGIDGVWVDGECWAVQADFSPAAKALYYQETGKQAALNVDYMQFNRKAFHNYLAHYTSVLHRFNPKLQIASNWAFSSFMPGPVDAGVDFLSGDIVHDESINVEFEPRVMANEGLPWDLMEWGFMGDKNGQGHYWKTSRMLEQKGAMIIAQGGGYQIYINQNHDASLPLSTVPALKEAANFCNKRKPYCFKTSAIPQIAMLFSGAGHNHDLGTITAFNQNNGGNDNIKGTLSMLLNSQYSVQVLQEFSLSKKMESYPLLVITEWSYLEPAFIKQVKKYVNNGGKLLVIGGSTCDLFNPMLPKSVTANRNNPAGLSVRKQTYGKGIIVGIDDYISLKYLNSPDEQVRKTVAGLINQLFPNPIVRVTGSDKIHVTLNKKDQMTLIHLVNAGDYWKILENGQLDFQLSMVQQLNISYRTKTKPNHIILQPNNIPLNYTYYNGVAKFIVPSVDIYSIIQVQ